LTITRQAAGGVETTNAQQLVGQRVRQKRHDQIRLAGGGQAALVDGHDSWVNGQPAHCHLFSLEPLSGYCIEGAVDDLDGDIATERGLVASIDERGRTVADGLGQLDTGDEFAIWRRLDMAGPALAVPVAQLQRVMLVLVPSRNDAH
jgi:hypothetical protein